MNREGYHRHHSAWQPSSTQERILDALKDGLTNAEIGVRLGVSPETVKWHVSEMLSETGLRDRRALAAWWRGGGIDDKRGGFRALTGLLRFAPVAAAVAAGTIAVRLLLPSAGEPLPPASISPPSPQPEVVEQTSTTDPDFQPNAWVVDLHQGSVEPVIADIWAAQWYEPGEVLLAKAGWTQVIIDVQGNAQQHFADDVERNYIGVSTWPVEGRGAFVWRWRDAVFSYYDAATHQEQRLLTLPEPPERRRIDLMVSPNGQRIAYTQIEDGVISLRLADTDGSDVVVALSYPESHDIWLDDWSPDSRRVLVTAGARAFCSMAPEFDHCGLEDPTAMVVELAGDIVWQAETGAWYLRWAGIDHLLAEDQVIAEHLLAPGVVCETHSQIPENPNSCLYTVQSGQTLADIANRFGIVPESQFFESTPGGWVSRGGAAHMAPEGAVLDVPVALQATLIGVNTGESQVLDANVRGLRCISPDGRMAITQNVVHSDRPDSPAVFRYTVIDLTTGATVLDLTPISGWADCNSRSWAPDGSMVVLSDWGK